MESGHRLDLDLVVLNLRVVGEGELGDGIGAIHVTIDTGVGLDKCRARAGIGDYHRPWTGYKRDPAGVGEEHELDRFVHDCAGCQVDESPILGECVVECGERVTYSRLMREEGFEPIGPRRQHCGQSRYYGAGRQPGYA